MFEHLPLLCSLCPHFFHRVCHFQPLHYLAFFYYSCQHTLSEGQKALSGWRGAMSRFLNVLRSWLMMTSIIVVGHSLQSFRDHTFLYENIYTGKPDLVNGLQARTFGVWTLLSSVVRCLCAIDIHNKTYLNPGHASGAPTPRSRTRIQTEEEKLRPTSPCPRRHLPPLLASSVSMLFSFISAPSPTYSLSHLGFFFFPL
ncbi:uncharacterized protein LOC112587956 isoform X2 [Bubalus bubalis]|uniref:uncharacterized protein LOC112587956 isoform X2 n=1 Tax=Bubalus bubalis TaxID=89462 RepID=UPI001E1B623B|nr:uncharacterized protein LOC112587956 isoform X2 [Bubalus bubalis]